MTKRIFISADHGMAIIYFLQSDVVPTLLAAGVEVVLLTDEALVTQLATRFTLHPTLRSIPVERNPALSEVEGTLTIEGLRLKEADQYANTVHPRWQWLLGYLRRVGGSRRINTEAMDSHI